MNDFTNPKLVRDDLLRSGLRGRNELFRVSVRFSRNAVWRLPEYRQAIAPQFNLKHEST